MSKIRPVTDADLGRRVIGSHTETLPTTLTQEERWDLAIEVTRLTCEYARLEEVRKAAEKEHKGKLKELRAEIDEKARQVQTGRADREVEIVQVHDLAEGVVLSAREDTGEIISRRRATGEERQESLDFGRQVS